MSTKLYMFELDIAIRMMTQREIKQFQRECLKDYNQWTSWCKRGQPDGEMVQ